MFLVLLTMLKLHFFQNLIFTSGFDDGNSYWLLLFNETTSILDSVSTMNLKL